MTQYQENYGQYSHQEQYSGLNLEDQSVAPPTAAGPLGSGYNNPGVQQALYTGDVPAAAAPPNAQYNAPPVQPMYTSDPQYQQGKAYWRIEYFYMVQFVAVH